MTKRKILSIINKIVFIGGILFMLLLVFLLICNLIIIIKQILKPHQPPMIFGTTCMVVQSNSMSGDSKDHIEIDDFIFIKKVKHDELMVNDIIAFQDDTMIVTHRIITIEQNEWGEPVYITKGDANNVVDDGVTSSMVIGKYVGKIPKIGRFVIFLQQPLGTVFIISIFGLFFVFERKFRSYSKTKKIK